ncbi:S9 family peptidase [Pleionea sp. CnH1-48]|uniref:S9 family peptidase n=1 Tax=Pleionea sp. CnH1-48 TaxID=2954494 RepID=UPI00209743FF|nr:S9 family peptidase [Pleionea sp. CnH1-48]MCO7226382.1 S9 family peptidase [Pleionea sp. CnH1-48]
MNKLSLVLLTGTITLAGCDSANTASQPAKTQATPDKAMTQPTQPAAPVAKKSPHPMDIHGDKRIDDYYWMRDDKREDKEILAHLEAENKYTKAVMAHTEQFQKELYDELIGRLKKDDSSVPALENGYWYSTRYEGDKEYPVFVRNKDKSKQKEEIILDENVLAEGHDYFALSDIEVSPDNKLLAYSTDTLSRRIYTVEFKNLETGEMLADKLTGTDGGIVWANDNQTVFYIKKDPQTLLGYQVYRHKLGTDQKDDVLVYEEKDTSFYTGIGKSKDRSTISIYHSSTTTQGASMINADTPDAEFKPFAPLEENIEYAYGKLGDWFYIRTNWKAKNFRLMKVHKDHTADRSKWEEVIAHNPDVYFQDFELFENYLVTKQKVRGQIQIKTIEWKTGKETPVTFDDDVFVAGFSANYEQNTDTLRLYYSSMTTPSSVYDYNLKTGEKTLRKRDEVIGDFKPENYHSERIFIKASDGVEVPVSIVYRKDKFKKDGTNPIYQYGYGSYGVTIEPSFSASRLSLLDRGVVYAIAHVRGSQMLGRPWYENGKMFNKKNSFTDFVDVTKALVEQKYGAKDKVFAVGGSAGGLLMGAIANMAPKSYLGLAAHVPFVDVVTTMLDESIPLTTNEYDEWGNPNNKDSYDYMLSYSPYDNVKKQDYPHILVTTGLHDSQVQYFEPAKWVAKLRDFKTDDNRLLFDVNMEAGHGGASGRFRRYKEQALEYAFFFDLLGIKK